MNYERERCLQEILTAALEVAPPDRAAWVREQVADDETLCRGVLEQLDEVAGLGDFLEQPAVLYQGVIEEQAPPDIDGFEILERLGGGAMGEVFRAEQRHPVRRVVALKRVHAHLPDEVKQRFFAEQQALARSSHEAIARIYDAGTTADETPWFSMELIEGSPITEYCDRRRLGVEDRLRLVLGVCAAVEHAHRKQILHRDLKPSNVLVVDTESGPRPKVIDFGIAKLLDGSAGLLTEGGSVGTPAYMSPEALGTSDAVDVDTRTDVYSLGVLLFELVVGRRPFDGDLPSLGELVRRVRDEEPPTASSAFSRLDEDEAVQAAENRSTDAADLRRRLRGDLEWILARALAPDRERRYGSPRELADDLRRLLADEPVLARPPSRAYRLRKFWRRHRTQGFAVVVAVLGLVVGAVSLAVGLLEARREAASARTALAGSEATTEFLVDLFRAADPTSSEGDLSVGDLLDRGAEQIAERLADQPLARGRLLHTLADVYMERGSYDQAEPLLDEALRLLRAELPLGDPERASALRSVGVLRFHRGDWTGAEEVFAQASEEIEPGTDPEGWALGRHNLGVAVYRQGRNDEAEEHLRAAYEVRRRELPADHPHLARSTNALGALLVSRNEPLRAIELLEDSLQHRARTLRPDHPDLAKTLTNIGLVEVDLGRYEAAVERFRRAITIEESALGPDHPDLARTLRNLGRALRELGESEEEFAALDRSVEILRSYESGPRALSLTLDRRAHAALVLRDVETAGADFREILRLQEEMGYAPEDQTRPRIGLAHVAALEGRLDQAEQVALEVLEQRQRAGKSSESLGYPKRVLALVSAARGDVEDAERWFRSGLEDFVQARSPRYSSEREMRRDFAAWLRTQSRDEEADDIERGGNRNGS